MTVDLGFAAFDADNHYYEAEDAFTRYADPALVNRTMQWVLTGPNKRRLLVGGKLNRFIANPTFDPVAKPGSLDAYYRGELKTTAIRDAFGELEPLPKEYRDRDARLALMDRQNLESVFLFPTLGVGMETALAHDIEALNSAFSAFNRWLDEDWGFNYKDRIYAAPMISLSDPACAIEELRRALERDVRIICLRLGPVRTALGFRSPADPMFDDFWSIANELGVTVAYHTGDAGYTRYTDEWEPFGDFRSFQFTPFRILASDRAITDTVSALICHGLFARFPNIRVASIENGGGWVAPLLKRLEKVTRTHSHLFHEPPVETFKRHIYVSPFHEDDVPSFIQLLGVEHVLFGSDFPHAEGIADPVSYVAELPGVSQDDIRLVMHDNARGLSLRRPLAARTPEDRRPGPGSKEGAELAHQLN